MKKLFFVSLLAFSCTFISAQNIYTIAGDRTPGYGNGDSIPATLSEVNSLNGSVAIDAAGNIFIPDYGNNRIRKIDAATGYIYTVAGTGTAGYNGDGISAVTAQLNGPQAVAVDAAGNLYIADYSNNRIRKVTASTGLISTIAGTGAWGYNGDNIRADTAKIGDITGIAVDTSGNVYISDLGNGRIREIVKATGLIQTIAGDGNMGYNGDNISAVTAQVNFPHGLAVDDAKNVYIADEQNHRIRRIDAVSGTITTVAGNGTPGYNGDNITATTANLYHPYAVALDANGNIYIADAWNNRIRKVNSGTITTAAGNGTSGYLGDGGLATSAQLNAPRGICSDPCGNLYISDYYNHEVRKVTSYSLTITSTNVSCNGGCNGTVSVSASGGSAPYTYSWSGGLGTGATHSGVCAGTYTATATDANGCTQNLSVVITQPTAIALTLSHVNTMCMANNGSAIGVATGGLPPFTYAWSNSTTNDTVTGLGTGTFTLTVTDANSCTGTQSVTIANDPALPATPPICMVTVDQASQYNVIVWDKTAFVHVDSFIIYREIATNNYQPIGAVPYDSLSQFIDTVRTLYFPNTGDPNAGTYRYKIQARDSCGGLSLLSPYHNTIYISNNNGTFTWAQLYTIEGGPNPVLTYTLLRDDISDGNWLPVGSVSGNQQTVSDPNYAAYSLTASWRVETNWNITCTPTMRTSSPFELQSLNNSFSNTQTNVVITSVDEIASSSLVTVFPNPNNGTFAVTVKTVSPAMRIEIYNAVGELVQAKNIVSENTSVDLSNEATGIYFYKVISVDGMISCGKVVAE
jgi:sugar lactone lactonase YvrE